MPTITDSEHIFAKVRVAHTLEVLDDSCTTFRSEHVFLLRAELRSRFFLRRYKWTGSDDDQEPELETTYDKWGHPTERIHGPVIREGQWRIVVVDLGRSLEVGEERTLHFRHRLKDLNGKFEPYLGHSPKPGTQHISLKVILPPSMSREVVYDDRVLDTENVVEAQPLVGKPVDGKVVFEKEIPSPAQQNRGYRIRWHIGAR